MSRIRVAPPGRISAARPPLSLDSSGIPSSSFVTMVGRDCWDSSCSSFFLSSSSSNSGSARASVDGIIGSRSSSIPYEHPESMEQQHNKPSSSSSMNYIYKHVISSFFLKDEFFFTTFFAGVRKKNSFLFWFGDIFPNRKSWQIGLLGSNKNS